MKIGIMGGTFDPIHKGHLMLGEYAYHSFNLDEVWFLPNGNPPHKAQGAIGSDIKHRLEMVVLAISDRPYFKLERYEADHQSVSYSYETMEYLVGLYPEHFFYFIIGADSLFSIEKWVHPERLLKTCVMLAACRGEFNTTPQMRAQIDYLKDKYQASIELLEMPVISVSSQEIRKTVYNRNDLTAEMLPNEISEYIEQNKLYEGLSDEKSID